MSENPLLDKFLISGNLTLDGLRDFVSGALGDFGNFELFDPATTLLHISVMRIPCSNPAL